MKSQCQLQDVALPTIVNEITMLGIGVYVNSQSFTSRAFRP